MNQADSEKVHMLLLQCGCMRASSLEDAHIVIFNTCSVRQKGEDRVFGMMQEIKKSDAHKKIKTLIGITGCMVRKTGIAKKYLPAGERMKTQKIKLLESEEGIYNSDDTLFPRSEYLDFTFRIEEIKYVPHILSHIF